MSEMSDMHKLIMAMKLAKTARVGMELTYFDVIELLGELDSLKSYIAELEEENETLKTACDILRGDNNLLFKRLMSIETPNHLQTLKIVYGKVCEE